MEPGSSRADNPPKLHSHTLANFIGTIIAVLTLTFPVVAIAHFSSSSSWQPPAVIDATARD